MKKIAYLMMVIVLLGMTACGGHSIWGGKSADTIALAECPKFQADSAMKYIKAQCDFGPRVTGSKESQECAKYIAQLFTQYGAKVEQQEATVTIYDGTEYKACNIVAHLNPSNRDRILLCSHWDSRPWADNDPDEKNHHKPVLAANDGASGVAVMLEICRLLQQSPIKTGIDFVCFDAEDMGTPQWAEADVQADAESSDTWCLGSRAWAEQAYNSGYKARFGILLDMVGGRGSTFSREQVSLQYAQPVVDMLWQIAKQLGYSHYFPTDEGGSLIDDHVNVNRFARVPCLDIVPYFNDGPSSFGPTWHTVNDTPENIDPNVLEAVGQSIVQLLYNDNEEE